MTQINIRLDDDLKARAEALFGELGMNMTTAVTLFIRQALLRGGIPFEVTTRHIPPAFANAADSGKKSAFGSLKRYANPSLIEQEESAWATAAGEKHGAC
jgi:DNA-damage-inducible protein J